uniref:Uncharacterized protein AlNc14C94G5786 n=1 Tax=Albugo laibachii Nc14 TaxID=890382 RepID=F0WGQ9_9STRA|nr:conserved hypothetical protein [Albugo laibachii Nc14]|eukprot:CCA20423.1 conserved hypothetical protein [Albugo laibachii Nc14]
MDWVRNREQILTVHSSQTVTSAAGQGRPAFTISSSEESQNKSQLFEPHPPKFVLIDSKNRIRELTETSSSISVPSIGSFPAPKTQPIPVPSIRNLSLETSQECGRIQTSNIEEDDDSMHPTQRMMEQQLQFQRQEMKHHMKPPKSAFKAGNLQTQHNSHQHFIQQNSMLPHAATYSDSKTAQVRFKFETESSKVNLNGLAASLPAKPSSNYAFGNDYFGVQCKNHLDRNVSFVTGSSPQLPSLDEFRADSKFRMGFTSPAISLRSGVPSSYPQLNFITPQGCESSSSSLASSYSYPHLQSPNLSQSSSIGYMDTKPMECVISDEDEVKGETHMMSAAMVLSSSMPTSTAIGDPMGSTLRSGRVCRQMDCSNVARSRGLCRTHGGGKRCSHPHCNKSAQANRKCIAHGGGTPCSFPDCEKTAQSRGLCKAHGGGARCKFPKCPKSSQSRGLCRGHGGGIKCKADGCEKWVQRNGYCIKHGREFGILNSREAINLRERAMTT